MKKFLILLASVGLLIGCALCLTACSGGKEYKITCDNSEFGRVIVADDTAKAGENVILAAKPVTGYQLVTFVLDGEELDGCSFVMPEKDVTVSAEFEIIEYTVTYDFGDRTETEKYTVENASEKTLPELTNDGFEKCGWYKWDFEYDSENTSEYELAKINPEQYLVTSLDGLFGNVTLYAKYYNPFHKITCIYPEYPEESNGSFGIAEDDFSTNCVYRCFGETVNIVIYANRGYELDYITVNGNPIEGTTYTVKTFDVEIEAVFKLIEYRISYELYGGTNAANNKEVYTVEDSDYGWIDIYKPTKDGYEFKGWYLDEDFLYEFYPSVYLFDDIEWPLTLYALFEEI